jgi:hypothetical protein
VLLQRIHIEHSVLALVYGYIFQHMLPLCSLHNTCICHCINAYTYLITAPLLVSHCIYVICAFNPAATTSKVYIGQTSRPIGERFVQHVRTMLRKRVYSNSDLIFIGRSMSLHAAMALYGPFEFMILPLQLVPGPFQPSFRKVANRFETLWVLRFSSHRPNRSQQYMAIVSTAFCRPSLSCPAR